MSSSCCECPSGHSGIVERKGFFRPSHHHRLHRLTLILKALSATGYRSESDAAQWLMSHLDDSMLDEPSYREFFLFLCVHSELAAIVQDYWNESSINEGRNHAHEFPPHITLLSNLRVSEDKVFQLHRIYDRIIQNNSHLLKFDQVPLKLVTSDDFIGYIVSSDKVNANLEKICRLFLQELLKADIIVDDDPIKRCKSNYHMSLAYGFQSSSRTTRSELQCSYDIENQVSVSWTLDLFSADCRLSTPDSELYEMQVTLEVDDLLFSRLALEENLPSLVSSSPEIGQIILTDHLSSSASSLGADRTPDSDSLQPIPSHEIPLNDPTSASSASSHTPTTLAHSAGDKVLLIGSCNLHGRYGVPIGLNLNSGVTGVFSLASARRIPKWHAWVTHRSTVVVGHHGDTPTAELCNTFIAPSKIPPSFSSTDFCEALGVLNPERCVASSSHSFTTGGGAVVSSNSSVFGGSSFYSKFLSRNSRRKSLSTSSSGSSSYSSSAFRVSFASVSPSSASTFGLKCFGNLLGGNDSGTHSAYNIDTGVAIGYQQQQQQSYKPQRRLFVMRHAERVDSCFGRAWITRCIDRRGLYHRLNLNMPPRLPVREEIIDHALDSPLTQVGLFVSGVCGRSLAESGVRFSSCYVSPALRCVQTAHHLLKAAGQSNLPIRIEPLLFEWLGWYSGKLPNFLSPAALYELGYNVDTTYSSISSINQLDLQETIVQFYTRSTQIVKEILDQNPVKGINILIVAHAASLDSCTRSLLRKRFRSGGSGSSSSNSSNGNASGLTNGNNNGGNLISTSNSGGLSDIEELHRRAPVPYCGLLCAVEGSRKWHIEEPPIPSLIHGQNTDFDWRQFHGSSIYGFGFR
nr:phosphoglycerate mutase [Hymenolepis microstoma]